MSHVTREVKGTGHSSGMLRVGELIVRVDKENTADLRADAVHRCLRGAVCYSVLKCVVVFAMCFSVFLYTVVCVVCGVRVLYSDVMCVC